MRVQNLRECCENCNLQFWVSYTIYYTTGIFTLKLLVLGINHGYL